MESGFGIISSLQAMGSGSFRSLSPWMAAPVWAMLYCRKFVKHALVSSGSGNAYKTIGEGLELALSF